MGLALTSSPDWVNSLMLRAAKSSQTILMKLAGKSEVGKILGEMLIRTSSKTSLEYFVISFSIPRLLAKVCSNLSTFLSIFLSIYLAIHLSRYLSNTIGIKLMQAIE